MLPSTCTSSPLPIDSTISCDGLTTCCAVAVAAGMVAIGATATAASSSLALRFSFILRPPSGLPEFALFESGRIGLVVPTFIPLNYP